MGGFPLKLKQSNQIKSMNELYKTIARSCHFKKWVKCQIAVKVRNDIWLYGDNELVKVDRLIEDYLKETKTFKQWVKIVTDFGRLAA